MVSLLVLPIQGADGQRSHVVCSNAVARTKVGQETSREGIVRESEDVGAVVSHIVEGDIMGLIIQEDPHPAGEGLARTGEGIHRCLLGTHFPFAA